ncbi:uncharacterized protein LOC132925524 [Rhopalosiphum padi]|uniref:uncharacterized protein LOC132925524 n=1 Tax=Rhopalosiphum padi TaxID=40932 RepID=UPI00298E08E7|nr:uncharacterized protein LOC132925524 [Rhopalosiphum padi]
MFCDQDIFNTSNISNLSELDKNLTNENLDDSLLSNLSTELTKIDSLFPTQFIQISNQRSTIKSSDVMSHAENDNFELDNVILDNNKTFLSKNKSHELVETRSQCKHDLSVLEDLAEVKVKVQKLLMNQNAILNKLDKLLTNDRSVDNCLPNITSIQIDEFEIHFNEHFPLKELTQFNHINEILNNKAYYTLMKKKLSMYGGSSINDVTCHILIRLLSNKISTSITFTGNKGKKTGFASTNYFKVLLEVVRVFYESATENHVKPAIQSWFKHAPDRLLTTTQPKSGLSPY